MNWFFPQVILLGTLLLEVVVLIAILFHHLAPHPEDIERISAHLACRGFNVQSVFRSRTDWLYHYKRGAWRLSRFARFYLAAVTAKDGEECELLTAVDPWRPSEEPVIISTNARVAR